MKVLITDKINAEAGKILEEVAQVDILPTMPEDELTEKIGEYDALMVRSQTKVTEKIINAAKNMKIIGRAGVGVDNIDLNAATSKGIIVVNSPDGNTAAAAEHTVALMLSMVRNIPQAAASTKSGAWDRAKFTGTELFGKTLGIIGLGKIGGRVMKTALALGMKVVVSDPYTTAETVEKLGGTYVENRDDFWGLCDIITVHVPKTPETANLINKDTIAKMKKGVRLINCARGGIINEKDLKEALDSGYVAGAAIDVYENEPNIQECPLLSCEKAVLTPHLGASTEEAQIKVALDVANQIKEVLKGGSASSAVNIPSLKPQKLEPVKDYMQLAENIGEFAKQISKGNLKSIEIKVKGTLSELDVSPLEIAILKGVFSSMVEGVNYVNAPLIAKSRNITVSTIKSQSTTDYIGTISVKLVTDKGEDKVAGALIAQNIKRIVRINNYTTSIKPESHILLVPHINQPMMIAQVATVIGKDGINVNRMQVAQKSGESNDNESIMIISTQTKVSEETLKHVKAIDGVINAQSVNLNVPA